MDPTETIRRAQWLRKNMSGVERRLWDELRARRIGSKFRRQHPIGPYIADFACVSHKLVIELDGDTHIADYDERRDDWMRARGWRVMRVPLQDVDRQIDGVVESIRAELEQPGTMLTYLSISPSISPSRPSWPPRFAGRDRSR